MNTVLPFIITGLVSGSVYGLTGTGLVLTYKTSGVFNFAHGALATVSAYLMYTLYQQHGMPWPLAALICVLGAGVVIGLGFEGFARRILRAPIPQQIAGTVGVMILIEAGATLIYGSNPLDINYFLPRHTYMVGGVAVGVDQTIIVGISVALVVALYVFLQRTRLGISMRGVVDNPELIGLSQFNPIRIRRSAWIIGCTLATLSGVLIAPFLSLNPTQLTLLAVQAFGAAAIGRFTSLPLTYVGGLALGVASSLCTKYVNGSGILGGLPASIPFIVLFLVLILTPAARLQLARIRRVPLQVSSLRLPVGFQLGGAVPVLALALLAPLFVSTHLLVWTKGLVFMILFASMVLLVRVSGQVSLCHVTFAAIGAATFAHLAGNSHWPWFAALVIAALCVVPIGAVLAIPASRLPVLYLGLATMGFGLMVQQMFYSSDLMFTSFAQGLTVGRPSITRTDKGFYYLVLILTATSLITVAALIRTRLGRVLRALSDSPLALSALGTDERVTRVIVFCISAFFAGLSGALYASLLGTVSDLTFDPLVSLTYLVLIVISVGDVVWASLGAAVGTAIIPGYVESGDVTQWLQLAFGAIAIFVAAGPGHAKLQAAIAGQLRRGLRSGARAPEAAQPHLAAVPPPEQSVRPEPAHLQIQDVVVQFGGLRAVDGVSLGAGTGMIIGLIGPNGAGKTTIFNVATGLQTPARGRVTFKGKDVTRLGTAHRARLGLGRTFQQPELFGSMSVAENIALGYEASLAGANPLTHLVSHRGERVSSAETVEQALELCGLQELRDVPVSALSTGQRRMVELARCVSSPADLLLLDEPSAGQDPAETERFGMILRRIVSEKDLGILLVEHDMDLVRRVCDYVYVLDFGQQIFEGTPAEMQASTVVQAAYLGESAGIRDFDRSRSLDDSVSS